nr:tegumental antigen [Hymenolepis microstoma]
MSMPLGEELADIFEQIDTHYNGYITREELEAYAKKTNQPEDMVDNWFKWFDYEGVGRITFEDMCETLAIGMSKTYSENVEKKREKEKEIKTNATKQVNPSLMEGVKVLYSGSVKKGLMEYVVQEVKNSNIDRFEKESQFAKHLKEYMEVKWGQHWQWDMRKTALSTSNMDLISTFFTAHRSNFHFTLVQL